MTYRKFAMDATTVETTYSILWNTVGYDMETPEDYSYFHWFAKFSLLARWNASGSDDGYRLNQCIFISTS